MVQEATVYRTGSTLQATLAPTASRGGVPSDWNAEPDQPGHILNRPFCDEILWQPVLPQITAAVEVGQNSNVAQLPAFALAEGESYKVIYNGREYLCPTVVYVGIGSDKVILTLGDMWLKEYPFFLQNRSAYMPDEGDFIMVEDGVQRVTLSISQRVVQVRKLDRRFLPEDIGVQSDWNATTEEAGHILNRTHWTERGMMEILPETTLATEEDLRAVPALGLVSGNTYTVTFNGAEFSCIAFPMDLDGISLTVLGNTKVVDGEDNGIPFSIAELPPDIAAGAGQNVMVEVLSEDYSIPFVITICGESEIIHKLEPKFLPDGAPYLEVRPSDGLPETVVANYDQEKGMGEITPYLDILPGGLFTVTYNGVEYRCKAQKMEQDGAIFTILGDGSSLGLTGNGEPFMLMCLPKAWAITEGIGAVVMVTDNPKSVTLKIEGTNRIAYPLSRELLPATDLINIRAYPDYTQVKLDATSATRITLTEEDRMILVNAKDSGIVKLNIWLDINGTCRFFTCTVSLIYSPENIYGTCLLHDGTYLVMQLVGNILHMWHKSKPGQI